MAASNYWQRLEEELDANIEVRRGGSFMVAETEEEAVDLRAKHELERRLGLATRLLSGEEARKELPLLGDSVLEADYCGLDGYANPLLATPAYLKAAIRLGAQLYPFTQVNEIAHAGGSYRLTTQSSVFESPVVINAAGAWITRVAALAGIVLDMAPVAIQMHATERIQPTMSHVIQHVGLGLSVKQVKSGQFLIGGGWPALDLNLEGRSSISVKSMLGNVALAHRVLPFLKNLRILRAWAGPLAATPDELPVIGEVPGFDGFFVVGGTYGFTLAPLWARVLTSLVLGSAPEVDLRSVTVGRLTRGADARSN